MEEEKLIKAIEQIRRDKHQPGRYLIFTFLNGIAYGLGMALGMTIILGLVVYLLIQILTRLIDFPVVGQYFDQIIKLIDLYTKQIPRTR